MKRELKPDEIIYDFNVKGIELDNNVENNDEYSDIYEKIKTALSIDKEGYNLYIIDDFSKDKLNNIKSHVYKFIKNREIDDICYVIYDDVKRPKALFLKHGYGKKLNDTVEKIQRFYYKITYGFYNESEGEKESIIESIHTKKKQLINKLIVMSKKEKFNLKSTDDGFIFVPIKNDGSLMNENDYDALTINEKESIISKVNLLKSISQKILNQLKSIELVETEKIKIIMDNYFMKKTSNLKNDYFEIFKDNTTVIDFLNYICKSIEKKIESIYSINYEDDEAAIKSIILKYSVNILVDNSNITSPPIIFEEDPSVPNLLGNIEYENKDGSYITNVNLVRPGSILKANGGCLILNMNSLLNNTNSYYFLKKAILSGEVKLDYKRGYLEVLSLSGMNPEPIKFNEKIILIGDYSTYNLLYNYDHDFKKIFKIMGEYNPVLNIDEKVKKGFLKKIIYMCRCNKLKPITDEGLREIAKIFSRKAENRDKLFMDDYEMEKILTISNNNAIQDGRDYIEVKDIETVGYQNGIIDKQIDDAYIENQIFIDTSGKKVGQVNALSILNTGCSIFGKPIKMTCSCVKGEGSILDVQRESDLSGKIHNKAISTISGYINSLIGGYSKLPVNFHLSFEQVYGSVDGDSASVAEVIAIISSLSKIGIRQNIAVTGSINQFGRVQPVGGVNEKIEGFFHVCKIHGSTKEKGVLIPESNIKSLALKSEVEEEIKSGKFHIYSMRTVEDAIDILMGDENIDYDVVLHEIKNECKKYEINKSRKH